MTASEEDRRLRMALASVADGGEAVVTEAVSAGGPALTWRRVLDGELGEARQRRAERVDPDALRTATERAGCRFVVPGDAEWPESLTDLEFVTPVDRRGGVPIGLWVKGRADLALLARRAVALVGARAATAYGLGTTVDLAAELAEAGVTVVSGVAYGIDAAAHRGARAVEGASIGVLACGVDRVYPAGNAQLYGWLGTEQALVSEVPPGEHPTRVRFLSRNRIIAALSQVTVVVEAALRSGARSTANWASQCGRVVGAVPGPVTSALSAGPHQMVRDHQAVLVTSAAEVVELSAPIGEAALATPRGPRRELDDLSSDGLAVVEAFPARGSMTIDEITLRAGLRVGRCLSLLAELEAGELVTRHGDRWQRA